MSSESLQLTILFVSLVSIIQLYLPVLFSVKYILLLILSFVYSLKFLFFSFDENSIFFLMFGGLVSVILFLGYKKSKKVEGQIIDFVNQQIIGTTTYSVSILEIKKIIEKDLRDISFSNNQDKTIKDIIEVLSNKGLVPSYIKLVE